MGKSLNNSLKRFVKNTLIGLKMKQVHVFEWVVESFTHWFIQKFWFIQKWEQLNEWLTHWFIRFLPKMLIYSEMKQLAVCRSELGIESFIQPIPSKMLIRRFVHK